MALTDSELSAILEREQRQAIAFQGGELSHEREDGLKRFYGEPYGNEEDGRSQVVMRDVQDVVEWLLPAQLKIFMSGDQVVEFQPRGPEDEEIAKQRTEYINYVFQQDNNGFLVLYTALKDAFIQKNGVVKVYWDEHALDETRTVEGIDDEAYTLLVDDPDIEILQHTARIEENSGADAGPMPPESGGAVGMAPGPESAGAAPYGATPPALGVASQVPPMASPTDLAGAPQAGPMGPGGPLSTPVSSPVTHDVKYRKSGGKVCVEPIPPEQWLISARATSITDAPYVADRKRKTISECISEGLITKDQADTWNFAGGDPAELTGEGETRNTVPEDLGKSELSDREGVMREVWVTDHYILVDADEDGIAERLRVVTIGATTNIGLQEEWEGPPPYASGSPILVPHRVIGQSIADQVSDLQLINTTLMRQMLDNLYRTNNPRYAGNGVDTDDWYSPNPGQLVKTDGNPNETLREITIPFTAGASLPVLEYIATLRENRTGVTRYNQGIDANSLNKTASGITQIMTAAQQRVELIARIFAETFIKPMFMLIDHCVTKYQNKQRVIRIRNEWVTVDPRQWESNFDMTINVGLGTGNKDQQLMHLQTIALMQEKIIMMQGGPNGPIVTLDNLYATMTKITENAGIKNVDALWTDPKKAALNGPPAPPPPDPIALKTQAEIEAKAKLTDAEIMNKAKQTDADIALKQKTTLADYALKFQGQEADTMLAGKKTESEIAMSKERMNGETQMKREAASAELAAKSGVDIKSEFKQIMQAMGQFAQAQMQANQQLSAQMQQIGQLIAAEKEIVRGPDGRAQGVRVKQAQTVQ